jgi:hypothetical protein
MDLEGYAVPSELGLASQCCQQTSMKILLLPFGISKQFII